MDEPFDVFHRRPANHDEWGCHNCGWEKFRGDEGVLLWYGESRTERRQNAVVVINLGASTAIKNVNMTMMAFAMGVRDKVVQPVRAV